MMRTPLVSAIFSVCKMSVLAGFPLFVLPQIALAACLQNQSDRTVYVTLSSSFGQKSGNLTVGERMCVKTDKGRKAVAKIVPYGGARFGCKSDIGDSKTSVLVRFGTMNNCSFEQGE